MWKLLPCLREERPELRITQVDLPPGITLVTGLDPQSTKLTDRYDEIVARYGELDYNTLGDWRGELVAPTDIDEVFVRELLTTG